MGRPVFKFKKIRNRYEYGSTSHSSSKATLVVATIIGLFLLLCLEIWVVYPFGNLTIGGVPIPIIISFLQDETARNAYFQGDRRLLHDRLQQMGIEERIKAFYRPQIRDEAKLDQHIHQLLYDRTGYVGKAYRVNEGTLVLK